MARSTREVFEDHLRRRAQGRLLQDLDEDYAAGIVLLCEHAPMIGREAVRRSAQRLNLQIPGGRYEYLQKQVQGEYAFLRWRAESAHTLIENGADTFVIRDGRIVMQSIYYTVQPR